MRSRKSTAAKSTTICALARPITCTCLVPTAASGTSRRSRRSQEVILCEALIDALTFWGAGFRNVTASYGVEGFTADHLALFKHYGIERVFIAYDRDEAGDRAAEQLRRSSSSPKASNATGSSSPTAWMPMSMR